MIKLQKPRIEAINSDGSVTVLLPEYGRYVKVSKMVQNGDGNTKTRKHGIEYMTGGMSLSPKRAGGLDDLCTESSPACVAGCLNETGLATIFDSIQIARKAKTAVWLLARNEAKAMIIKDIQRLKNKTDKQGKKLAIRLNMFSDIIFEKEFPEVFTTFPDVQFYDYTKHASRFYSSHKLPDNYHLTFSMSEKNHRKAKGILKRGYNVAVVFHNEGKFSGSRAGNQVLPEEYAGFPVYDGDKSDMRFEDDKNVVVGLKLKASSNKKRAFVMNSGFSIKY